MSRIPIALQLYSVRQACAEDLAGTLEAVAKMGYEGVEFAGFYNRSAKELRQMLADNGLQVAGAHIRLDELTGDQFQRTVEFNQELGNKYLILPSVPESMRNTKEACLQTARLLDELAEKLLPYGMFTGYHNHKVEVQPLPGQQDPSVSAFTTLFDATRPEVVVQIDIGHAMRGGADPVALIERYPGRAKTVHVKEYAPNDDAAVVGEGVVPWADVFSACERVGGTEWYIVEHEHYSRSPLECVELCLKNLRAMGK